MNENHFEFNPYNGNWQTDGVIYAKWLKDIADRLVRSNREGETWNLAREAGKEASKRAQSVISELQRAEVSPSIAFGAAWDLCHAFNTLAKWEAEIGKKMLPTKAAKKARPRRKVSRIWTLIEDAWNDYLEECQSQKIKPAMKFFSTEWLREHQEIYDIEFDDYNQMVTLKGTSEQLKTDTIRKRVAR
jgi:hypothetical protein